MIDIILLKTEIAGNLGAIARVMKNFGFRKLILVDPECDSNDDEAQQRAKHAKDILDNAKVVKKIPKYDHLIATTAILGTDYNMARSPLTPKQLHDKLAKIDVNKSKIGILFGPEGNGLTNEEVKLCDFVVTIPSSKEYPTLNLSHSVGIICYELSTLLSDKKVNEHIIFASEKDKDVLLKKIYKLLDKTEFSTLEKRETQKLLWKKIIGKSFLTKRESMALHGLFNKLK